MEFDYKKELLPGLPIPEEGTVSNTVYYTGGTLSDVRQIINPDYFPLFENGLELSEEEFLALSTKLDRSNINFTYRYRKGGHLGYRLKYNRRIPISTERSTHTLRMNTGLRFDRKHRCGQLSISAVKAWESTSDPLLKVATSSFLKIPLRIICT